MKISISNLSEGVHSFHFSAEPTLLGLGSNFDRDVIVDVKLNKTSREVLLQTQVSTVGTFICDRCIDGFQRGVTAAYRIVYLYDERGHDRYPDGEVQIIAAGTPFIDITEDVRQYLLLAVPVKLLCKESCKGLCPHCGTNHNHHTCSCQTEVLEPRWPALRTKKK
jgi:uncharacterized protein